MALLSRPSASSGSSNTSFQDQNTPLGHVAMSSAKEGLPASKLQLMPASKEGCDVEKPPEEFTGCAS